MNEARVAQFAQAYCARMIAAMQEDPSRWVDTPATAPALARRMTEELAVGRAHLSAQGRAAARSLGIRPSATAIRGWLCAHDGPALA